MPGYQKVQQKVQQKKSEKPSGKSEKLTRQSAKHDQIFEAPETMRSEDVISAQHQAGNQVVQRALDKSTAREASTDQQGNLLPEISSEIQQSRGSGNSLPKDIQKEVSQSMGQDFSQVRIHTDEKSDKLSRMINARAFTIGKDIFFKQGVFSPGSSRGRNTLLHELTHVVQQSGSTSSGGKLKLGAVGSSHEHEAERVANKLGNPAGKVNLTARGGVIQKQGDEEEIQTQADEEEIQTQAEEEEVQMQPEGGVVQRSIFDRFKKKPLTPEEEESRKKTETQKNSLTNMLRYGNKDSENYKDAEHQLRTLHKTGMFSRNPATIALKEREGDEAVRTKIKKNQSEDKRKEEERVHKLKHDATVKSAREGDEGAIKQLRDEEEQNNKAKVAPAKTPDAPQKDAPKAEKHQSADEARRETLLKTIKNPRASHEEVTAAESELRKYHSRFGKSNYANDAISHRRERLEKLAKSGHKESQEKLDALNKSNPSKTSRFKSFMSSKVGGFLTGTALPGLKGLLSSQLGTAAGSAKTLLSGPGAKAEGGEKDAEKGGGEAKGSGGGGGGAGGGVAEMLAHLVQENKTLREQLAAVKKAPKEPEPVK
jgi:hypothetical protein